ncbi:bifunctional hydroxymethylpyrimidine kinase/phosphomethylpyrimidine kinase [Candidatus Sumerlaeota bacterium]|nr:bifunctional hydroxymethylpyrimidine kinase/phosphomethylpyrimidine kinase [Candidatus Sumerlaeota bacterium]
MPPSHLHRLRPLLRWLAKFPKLRVGVIGDFAIDHYLVGKTSRISREAPVLILKKLEDFVRPGQAGNSAANLAALGASCTAFGVIGPDREGDRLIESLRSHGIATSGLVRAAKGRSIIKTRVLAGAHHTTLQQVIRLDDDEGLAVGPAERKKLASRLKAALPRLDAILVSDYGYGTVDLALWNLLGAKRNGGPIRVLDSRFGLGTLRGADVITPNETEVFAHLGIEKFAGADPIEAGRRLIREAEAVGMVMTRGNEGMLVFDGPAPPKVIPIFGTDEVTDVTGAGDTVAAVVTAVLAAGGTLAEAASLANVAAGLKVMKRGAAAVPSEEIRAAILRPKRS